MKQTYGIVSAPIAIRFATNSFATLRMAIAIATKSRYPINLTTVQFPFYTFICF